MARRRSFEVFTLSFLDTLCCAFGAVILFYTIVSAQSGVVRLRQTDLLSSEVSRLQEEVLAGERNLVVLRDTQQKTRNQTASATRETDSSMSLSARWRCIAPSSNATGTG